MCINCTTAIKQTISADEQIISKAKEIAKEGQRSVALFRDHLGKLCIATGGGNEPICYIVTPIMQNNDPGGVH